jgi:hypothetical protein
MISQGRDGGDPIPRTSMIQGPASANVGVKGPLVERVTALTAVLRTSLPYVRTQRGAFVEAGTRMAFDSAS